MKNKDIKLKIQEWYFKNIIPDFLEVILVCMILWMDELLSNIMFNES